METADSIRQEIARLREEIDLNSCQDDEKAFDNARSALGKTISGNYSDSYLVYIWYCFIVPLVVCLSLFLLYVSSKTIKEWILLRRLSRQMRQLSPIKDELHTRELTQASRRSARRRTAFVITLKCIIASSVLLLFVGSRVLMEVSVRGWLKNLLVSPTTTAQNDTALTLSSLVEDVNIGDYNGGANVHDPWFELYADLALLLSVDWFRDLQGLLVFSLLGSALMVFGLRLLRSASEDVASMQTDSTSSLWLLQSIDDRHMRRGQELMQKQLMNLITTLVEEVQPQMVETAKRAKIAGKEENQDSVTPKNKIETTPTEDKEDEKKNSAKREEESESESEKKALEAK